MNTNLAYISALTAALRAQGVDVEDGRPGPWGSWQLDLRMGWLTEDLMLWAYHDAGREPAEAVAAAVVAELRQRMVAVLN